MFKRVIAFAAATQFLIFGPASAQSPVLDRILERGEIRVATAAIGC